MNTIEVKKTFKKAFKEISKIRFYDGWLGEDEVKPEEVEICDKKNCNAGSGCCHRFFIQGIAFCVY